MKLTSLSKSVMVQYQLESVMVVAMKSKPSGRRPVSRSNSSPTDIKLAHALATVATPGGEERHGLQDPVLTKIGTSFALASLIFDGDWYRGEYPDVAAASMDAVKHYFDNGSREGRNPNRYFDTNWYASNNPDVAAAGLNPFLHYLLYGAREGRKPAPS